ncbi:MAG: FAD-binding oxidoreductase [Paracoccaceae bacterium]
MVHTLVIGAGIAGASIALECAECAERGDRVTILSTDPAGGLASASSFGWLNASFYLTPEHFTLRFAAMRAHRHLAERLPGLPTRWPGCLWYEETGPAQDDTARTLRELGYAVEPLSRAGVTAMLPALGPVPDTALFFPEEGVADPADLARALIAASGATLAHGTAMALVTTQGRVTGVRTAEGEIAADRVVLATGTGTPALLAPLGLDLPMLKRPGMIVATAPLPPLCPLILATPGQEVRQDGQGRLLAPASPSHQSDAAETLGGSFPALVSATLTRLRDLFPTADIQFGSHRMAQRPVPGDGLPVAGPTRLDGLWIAVMHSGATLAPLVGTLLAQEIHGGPESPLLAPFRPSRFGL